MFGEQFTPVYPKIKFWMGEIIGKNDLDNVIAMDYGEFVRYLRSRTGKINLDGETSTEIEGQLKQEGFNYLISSKRYLTGPSRDFIKSWSRIYEIENLKNISRALLNGKKIEFLYDLGSLSKIQKEMVNEITSLDDFLQFLSGTPYYRLAFDSFTRIKEDGRTFYFETNLDNYYADLIKRKSKTLGKADRVYIRSIFFYYLELNRILWIYRLKFNYNLPNEAVVSLLPNIFRFLSASNYTSLVESDSGEDYINKLVSFEVIEKSSDRDVDFSLEKALNTSILKRARKNVSGTPFNIGALLGFIIMNTINIKNVVMLLEGKKIGFENDKLLKMLVI